jgi:hypothetical protein
LSNHAFLAAWRIFFSLFAIAALFLFLLACRKKIILHFFQVVALIALASFGAINTVRIHADYSDFASWGKNDKGVAGPVYTFSQNGRNVLFIMLDREISGYIPYIFEEKPEVYATFSASHGIPTAFFWRTHHIRRSRALRRI